MLLRHPESNYQAFDKRPLMIVVVLSCALITFEVVTFDLSNYVFGKLITDFQIGAISIAAMMATIVCVLDLLGMLSIVSPNAQNKRLRDKIRLTNGWIGWSLINALITWIGVLMLVEAYNFSIGTTMVHEQQLAMAAICAALGLATRISLLTSIYLDIRVDEPMAAAEMQAPIPVGIPNRAVLRPSNPTFARSLRHLMAETNQSLVVQESKGADKWPKASSQQEQQDMGMVQFSAEMLSNSQNRPMYSA